MLKLDQVDFTCGRALFLDSVKGFQEPTAKIFVKISLEGRLNFGFYAQLDTGAAWSVLDPVLARAFGLMGMEGVQTKLNTRFGLFHGSLIPLRITFLAKEDDIWTPTRTSSSPPPGR